MRFSLGCSISRTETKRQYNRWNTSHHTSIEQSCGMYFCLCCSLPNSSIIHVHILCVRGGWGASHWTYCRPLAWHVWLSTFEKDTSINRMSFGTLCTSHALKSGHLTNQDTSPIRTPHQSGRFTNQDTSPITTPHQSGCFTNQDTLPIRTLH